jgi:MerR family transcriptional regulator, copper efflux regulator
MTQQQDDKKLLKVGDLAKAVSKTVRAIHLYEELGLLVPVSRSTGGYRLYTEDAVSRVNWIVRLQDLGLSLGAIQSLLREWEQAPNGSTGMKVVQAMFEQKLRETREAIEKMQTLAKDLQASLDYLASCNTCEPSHVQSECKGCGHHGHVPSEAPQLVAGLARPRATFDVAVGDLIGEGNR